MCRNIPRDMFACSVAEYPTNLLQYLYTPSVKLKVPCSGRCCPPPPCEPAPRSARRSALAGRRLLGTRSGVYYAHLRVQRHTVPTSVSTYIPTFASLDRFCTVTPWYTLCNVVLIHWSSMYTELIPSQHTFINNLHTDKRSICYNFDNWTRVRSTWLSIDARFDDSRRSTILLALVLYMLHMYIISCTSVYICEYLDCWGSGAAGGQLPITRHDK